MAGRMQYRAAWVDRVVDQAIARGEFDNLPLAGKPIPGIGARHDPDWWLKALIEREQISGVLPEAIQLRKDDAALGSGWPAARRVRVREVLAEFNARIVAARRQLMGGPPVVTPLRDVEREVAAWRARHAPAPPPSPRPGAAPGGDEAARSAACAPSASRGPSLDDYSRSSSAGRIVVGMAKASAMSRMPRRTATAPHV